MLRPDPGRQSPDEQGGDRPVAEVGGLVEGHDPAAQVVGHLDLERPGQDREAQREAEADERDADQRDGQRRRERRPDRPDRLEDRARAAPSGATSRAAAGGRRRTSARADPTLWAATTRPAALSGSPRPSTTIAGDSVRMTSSGALTDTIPTQHREDPRLPPDERAGADRGTAVGLAVDEPLRDLRPEPAPLEVDHAHDRARERSGH